jgi:conjugative transfer signal peptidase TraF
MRAWKRRLATMAGEAGGCGPRQWPVHVGTPRPHGSPSWRPWPRRVSRVGVLWLLVLSLGWLRLNVSASVPLGLYRLHRVPASLEQGMVVVLPVPASVRAWQWRWLPLLKPVAGLPGDAVCITDDGLWINAHWYGPVLSESNGRALPRLRGCFTVGPSEVVLASAAPRSLDSRYFGPVPIADLSAMATPWLIWRD